MSHRVTRVTARLDLRPVPCAPPIAQYHAPSRRGVSSTRGRRPHPHRAQFSASGRAGPPCRTCPAHRSPQRATTSSTCLSARRAQLDEHRRPGDAASRASWCRVARGDHRRRRRLAPPAGRCGRQSRARLGRRARRRGRGDEAEPEQPQARPRACRRRRRRRRRARRPRRRARARAMRRSRRTSRPTVHGARARERPARAAVAHRSRAQRSVAGREARRSSSTAAAPSGTPPRRRRTAERASTRTARRGTRTRGRAGSAPRARAGGCAMTHSSANACVRAGTHSARSLAEQRPEPVAASRTRPRRNTSITSARSAGTRGPPPPRAPCGSRPRRRCAASFLWIDMKKILGQVSPDNIRIWAREESFVVVTFVVELASPVAARDGPQRLRVQTVDGAKERKKPYEGRRALVQRRAQPRATNAERTQPCRSTSGRRRRRYTLGTKLGEGSYSIVYLAKVIPPPGRAHGRAERHRRAVDDPGREGRRERRRGRARGRRAGARGGGRRRVPLPADAAPAARSRRDSTYDEGHKFAVKAVDKRKLCRADPRRRERGAHPQGHPVRERRAPARALRRGAAVLPRIEFAAAALFDRIVKKKTCASTFFLPRPSRMTLRPPPSPRYTEACASRAPGPQRRRLPPPRARGTATSS